MPLSKITLNVVDAVQTLLNLLNIKVTRTAIINEIEKHPYKDTLLGISDLLSNWNISNTARQIDREELKILRGPFISYLNSNNGEFVVIDRISDSGVTIIDKHGMTKVYLFENFINEWNGIILTANKTPLAGQSDYKTSRALEIIEFSRKSFVTVTVFIILAVYLYLHINRQAFSVIIESLFLTKSFGCIASILLLIKSMGFNNKFIDKVCGRHIKADCNSILNSKASKIGGIISWAEVGFLYFLCTWFTLLLNPDIEFTYQLLYILAVASLPYTIYSIYYQAFVAKAWCVLCTSVQLILWVEFFLISTLKVAFRQPSPLELGNTFIGMILPVTCWLALKPFITNSLQLESLKFRLNNFLTDIELFDKVMEGQPKYTLPGAEWSITLGNKKAGNVITMVSNPFCAPCGRAHKLLDNWAEVSKNVQVRVVFIFDQHSPVEKMKFINHIMLLNEMPDKSIVGDALSDWYAHKYKDFDAWTASYPADYSVAIEQKLEKQLAWCKMANFQYTPTILIKGQVMPERYSIEDLKYMI